MLIGHLGDDVKMHFFDGGGSIGRFPLATNESYVNKNSGYSIILSQARQDSKQLYYCLLW
jgi:single-strand DNA-binding protein